MGKQKPGNGAFVVEKSSQFEDSDAKFNSALGSATSRVVARVPGLKTWQAWYVDNKWKKGVLHTYILVLTSTKGEGMGNHAYGKVLTLQNHKKLFCSKQLESLESERMPGESSKNGGIRFTYEGIEDWNGKTGSTRKVHGETIIGFAGCEDESADLDVATVLLSAFVDTVKSERLEATYVNNFDGLKEASQQAALMLNLFGL